MNPSSPFLLSSKNDWTNALMTTLKTSKMFYSAEENHWKSTSALPKLRRLRSKNRPCSSINLSFTDFNKTSFIAAKATENICWPHLTNRRHLEDFFSFISGDLENSANRHFENFYRFKTWWSFLRRNLEKFFNPALRKFSTLRLLLKTSLSSTKINFGSKFSFWEKSQDAFKNQYPLFASSAADT